MPKEMTDQEYNDFQEQRSLNDAYSEMNYYSYNSNNWLDHSNSRMGLSYYSEYDYYGSGQYYSSNTGYGQGGTSYGGTYSFRGLDETNPASYSTNYQSSPYSSYGNYDLSNYDTPSQIFTNDAISILPECQRLICKTIAERNNLRIENCSDDFNYESVCRLVCDFGYQLTPSTSDTLTCGSNAEGNEGVWDHEIPTCM